MKSKQKLKPLRQKIDVSNRQIIGTANPYADEFNKMKAKLQIKSTHHFFGHAIEERSTLWNKLDAEGEKITAKYSWAIPDDRALNIIANFNPVIEIGCGKGYWAKLLQNRGVDITPYDKYPQSNSWTTVLRGGPEAILIPNNNSKTLFLCYPDESESMAITCLENFKGEYIIHVGELMITSTIGGAPQAPFGRTSSGTFQLELSSSFHCVLVAKLINTFPYSNDCISVWKRTNLVLGRIYSNQNSSSSSNNASVDAVEFMSLSELQKIRDLSSTAEESEHKSKEIKGKKKKRKSDEISVSKNKELLQAREAELDIQYSEPPDKRWAYIPDNEELPIDRAAPYLQHLLVINT
eukprot:gene9543-12853_t